MDSPKPTRTPRGVIGALVFLAVIVVAASVFFVWRRTQADPPAGNVGLEAGMIAPDFSLPALDGQTVRLSDYRGKPVVLNFFAGWCGPCKAEAPHLQGAYEKGNGTFALLGITFQDTTATAQNFVDEHGLTFPILLDESEEVGQAYKIRSFPVSFYIRPDGVIHTVIKGPMTREFVLVMLDGMKDAAATAAPQ